MTQWGDILLRWSGGGKTRSLHEGLKGSDPGLRSLSYYTDNGAYYYYQVREERSEKWGEIWGDTRRKDGWRERERRHAGTAGRSLPLQND